jgi:hypothetical protein
MKVRLLLICASLLFVASCATTDYATKLPEIDLSQITADLNVNIPIGKRVAPNQYYRAPRAGAVVVNPEEWDRLQTDVKKSESMWTKFKNKLLNKEVRLVGPPKPKPSFKDRIFGIFHKDPETEVFVDPTRRY